MNDIPTRTPVDPLVQGLHDRLSEEEREPKPRVWDGPDWPWFLSGSRWPRPCLRCGSFDHADCYA